jgi:hypothetical protein
MWFTNIIMGMLGTALAVSIWLIVFFSFDSEILNGYFKHKLQQRFKKDEAQ